ncbi:MAG TPA: GspH/FimT family pseudopilin [Acetobacteraceae bacterium]
MTWPNNKPSDRGAAAGFTLIEVIVVLVILGLGMALLTTRGRLRSTALDLRAATGEITQALRLARARAIVTDRQVVVALDPAGNAFRVGSGPAQTLPRGIVLEATAVQGPAIGIAAFRFAPDGSASGGRITLTAGGRSAMVGVDWLTGRVSVGEAIAR